MREVQETWVKHLELPLWPTCVVIIGALIQEKKFNRNLAKILTRIGRNVSSVSDICELQEIWRLLCETFCFSKAIAFENRNTLLRARFLVALLLGNHWQRRNPPIVLQYCIATFAPFCFGIVLLFLKLTWWQRSLDLDWSNNNNTWRNNHVFKRGIWLVNMSYCCRLGQTDWLIFLFKIRYSELTWFCCG